MKRSATTPLLGASEPGPVARHNPDGASEWLIVCDHAGRAIPQKLGDLGLTSSDLDRHIAWDIGVAQLGLGLAEALNACVIQQVYSRLVIDCNRAPGHPGSIPTLVDETMIPGNQGLTAAEMVQRVGEVHEPYHAAIGAELDARSKRGRPTVLLLLHSFTPRLAGFDRPWRFGVLHEGGSKVSRAALQVLGGLPHLVVGDNQPYAMDDIDYTAPRHALSRRLDYLELEVRQDLLGGPEGVNAVAALLARTLPQIIEAAGH